jgi:hypothetical protein
MQWRWPIPLTTFLILVVVTPLYAQAPAGTASEAASPIEALHQVQSNDNLHLLAAYYYGDARQWVQILNTNRDGIQNPNLIQPGQILRISLSPKWNPSEPYMEWRRRVGETIAPARLIAPEVLREHPTPSKALPPVEASPPEPEEKPSAPPTPEEG